jgi:hypothetical protein
MRVRWFLASLICTAAPLPALAAIGNVIFNGTIAATCTLTVDTNDTMTVSPDLQSLSSNNAGGARGTVTLSTTGGVTLGVDPVTSTTAPVADVTATTWTPTYASSGAHAIAETGSSSSLTTPGSSTVMVNLAGTRGGSDRFTAGSYQVTVTVRCE